MRKRRAIAVAIIAFAIGTVDKGQTAPTFRLFKDSRQQLAVARAQGRDTVTLVVAAVPGETAALAKRAASLGAAVRYRDDESDYLRVRVPINRALDVAKLDGIEAAALDKDSAFPFPLGGDLQIAQLPPETWPPRLSDYPLRHQYSPASDLGVGAFADAPTFDGRGVTIAVLDGNMDPLLPEYQTAYALDGTSIPKFADYMTASDPRDDAESNPEWVDMHAMAETSDGRISLRGRAFRAPRPGAYRIGLFDERRFNTPNNASYIDQDVDRNGNPKGDDGFFGVLWDETSNDVWVDTNRNGSFADETPLTDFSVRPQFGVFGHDRPETPVRESIAFAVQTDRLNKFVAINIGIYQHGTIVISPAVANVEPHGRIRGVAPGARLVSISPGISSTHGAIESMIRAFKHPAVDLIVFEPDGSMTASYVLSDAHHPMSVIAQRLTDRYQKLMFVPAGNAAGLGLVHEDAAATGVVAVGGYQSRESYLINDGVEIDRHDNLHWNGLSHGPTGNGALKPDLLAPSGQIGTDIGIRNGWLVPGLFQLPPGYRIAMGTSTAAPMAAGVAALLVSAAKQRGLEYDAARLKMALLGGARFLPDYAAHEQGAGLVQIDAAYKLLEQLQSIEIPHVDSRAPVRTTVSDLLRSPNEGPGLYEREGWKSGDRGQRTVTLTRTSGSAVPVTVSLEWMGNDGTFAAPRVVELPLNQPVQVPVTITVASAGPHSAILVVKLQPGNLIVHRVLCTIVAALPLNPENEFSTSIDVELPPVGDESVFLDVPPGTDTLLVSTSVSSGSAAVRVISPERDDLWKLCGSGTANGPCAIPAPHAGVWEINLANRQQARPVAERRRIALKATAVGVQFEPMTAAERVGLNSSFDFPLRITTRAALQSAEATGALASAHRASATINDGEQHVYTINVPPGALTVLASVHARDGASDLDIYLLDCTSQRSPNTSPYDREQGGQAPAPPAPACQPRAKASDVGPDGQVEAVNPAPGRWIVAVDGFSIADRATMYDYTDAFTHPKFGSLTIADSPKDRRAGETWSLNAHAWRSGGPEPARTSIGILTLMSPEALQSTAVIDSQGRIRTSQFRVPVASLTIPVARD